MKLQKESVWKLEAYALALLGDRSKNHVLVRSTDAALVSFVVTLPDDCDDSGRFPADRLNWLNAGFQEALNGHLPVTDGWVSIVDFLCNIHRLGLGYNASVSIIYKDQSLVPEAVSPEKRRDLLMETLFIKEETP